MIQELEMDMKEVEERTKKLSIETDEIYSKVLMEDRRRLPLIYPLEVYVDDQYRKFFFGINTMTFNMEKPRVLKEEVEGPTAQEILDEVIKG